MQLIEALRWKNIFLSKNLKIILKYYVEKRLGKRDSYIST